MDDKPSEYQTRLLRRYLKALKWICKDENINTIVLEDETRVNEKNKKIREQWLELNAEISKNALESVVFAAYLDVFLNKFEDDEKKKIEQLKQQ